MIKMTKSEFNSITDLSTKLDVLNRMMRTKKFNPEEVSEIMQTDIRPAMLSYISRGTAGKYSDFTDTDKQNVFMMIQILQYIYNYSGLETGLSDIEYDALYEVYINLGNEDFITPDLPFDVVNTAHHKYPSLRGTLTKVYYLFDNMKRTNPSRKYLHEWISARERELEDKTGSHINLNEEEIYVFPKWDGVSCIFEFNPDGSLDKALTRGNVYTNIAQNITGSFPHMKGKKTPNGYGLKTEIMMKEDDLDYYNKKYGTDYKNTRSIVSGILNSNSCDERNDLLVIQRLRDSTIETGIETLQELDDGAFESPYIECKLKDTDKIEKFAQAHRYVNGLRCDGAVIYIKDKELRKLLGREDNKNKYEVAYKFTEEVELSRLKDVKFQVGINGKISPVAIIKPVKLKGNTISRVSLGSIQRFHMMKLRKGDTVKVLYDIIPYMVKDLDCVDGTGDKIKAPKTCPYCGKELEKNEEGFYVRCINPNCIYRKKGAILNYLRKMDIKNISTATIDDFFDEGILMSIPDIYTLKDKMNEIKKIDGYGDGKINLILESIDSHMDVLDYQLLGSIGIDSVAVETAKKIMSMYNLSHLLDICEHEDVDALCEIPSIKEKTAKKIIKGIRENMSTIVTLLGILRVSHKSNITSDRKFSVVFTKVRDPLIEVEVEKRGGEILESITKSTTYCAVPDMNAESSKITKAKKWGIPLVKITDLLDRIDKDFR